MGQTIKPLAHHLIGGHMAYKYKGIEPRVLNICITPRMNQRRVWSYINAQNHGSGLSPDPTPRHLTHSLTLNKFKPVYISSHKRWSVGWMAFAKALCGGEVRGLNPTDSNIILYNNNKPIKGCHVATHDWAMWHLTIDQ
jgi:hypothetical protein